MKNITLYSLLFLLVTICFSCIKEKDVITENEPEVIIEEGETSLITGIVRDTSGTVLAQASVKIVFDDLELVTESDENGTWELIIPSSLTEGFVVANKVEYSKSIQRFNELEENRVEDIYLATEPSNTELDLGFVQGSLKIVVGRIIDQIANPIPNVTVFLVSLLENSNNEYVFNGFVPTRADGTFEIIYEDEGFSSSTLYSIFSGACSDYISVDVLGQDLIEDLGDIELYSENFSIFQTTLESDGSSCYENVSTLAYHWNLESAFLPIAYDQPLGAITLEYCPEESGTFYVGVESEDNTYFNGLFVSEAEIEASYMFDICTPNAGNFLELNINGNVTIYEDNLSFGAPRTIISQDPDTPLVFTVLNWITYTAIGSDSPSYQIGELKSLAILGANEVEFNRLDEDSPSFNYVNIVQDDDTFYAGIAQAKHIADDGSEVDIAIRFRVEK